MIVQRNMILLIQTLAKVVAKSKFGLCVIAKLRGQLLYFSFIQKFLHVRFCFGPGDRIFVCLRDCTIPQNCRFLPHNLPPKTRTIFFFSRTLSEALQNVEMLVITAIYKVMLLLSAVHRKNDI